MHVLTGEIRKEVFTKTGSNNNGQWKMYIIELTESFKDKDGNKQYTNYSATLFAKEKQIAYYDDWLQKGSVVSVTAEKLEVRQREHNGKIFVSLAMVNPNLAFFQSKGNSNGWGQPQQPQGGNQSRQQNSAPPSGNEPPMDFDDEIPF